LWSVDDAGGFMTTGETLPYVPSRRVPSQAEFLADAWVHYVGVSAGMAGAIFLVFAAALYNRPLELGAMVVYALGLLAMLICSALYNTSRSQAWRPLLRRLDHGGIFLMIAGTYTPFLTRFVDANWAIGLGASIWIVASTGIAMVFVTPGLFQRCAVVIYLAMSWAGLLAIQPMVQSLGVSTLLLVGAGGIIYTAGVIFHQWERLPYQNAIWHVFVLVAAVVHYLAVLDGLILTAPLPWPVSWPAL
jgi:hemolysin III